MQLAVFHIKQSDICFDFYQLILTDPVLWFVNASEVWGKTGHLENKHFKSD